MTRKEFGLFTAALKTYYSTEKNLIPNKQAMELWYERLKDIPFNVAEAALNKWADTHEWSPKISQIRAEAASITNGEIPDWGEGWDKTVKAIRKYGHYNARQALDSLDPLTRKTVERLGFTELCRSENVTADRANFRMIYTQLAERQKQDEQISPALADVITKLRIGDTHERKNLSLPGEKAGQANRK